MHIKNAWIASGIKNSGKHCKILSRQLKQSLEFYKWSVTFYYLAVVDLEMESSKSPTILKRSSKFGYTISSSKSLLLVLSTTNYLKIKNLLIVMECLYLILRNQEKQPKNTDK